MAAIISTYSGYVALSFLPPVIWLLFYLREDRHPEPKRLLLLTFLAGMLTALAAVALEILLVGSDPIFQGVITRITPKLLAIPLVVFGVVALIEEYLKYLAVKFAVLERPEFDEPIDAMIYLMTAALGFAALENTLFLLPVFEENFLAGFSLTANRFLGANLLHALTSGIVGYAVARHFWSPHRKHAIAVGVAIAAGLHTLFNYLIIRRGAIPEAFALLVILIGVMAAAVFVEFERLKKKTQISTDNLTNNTNR